MSWLDRYRQASFRNVEFYIPAHEGRGGRRVQSTEFPGRDEPYVQDHGRKSGGFTIDAYIIGDDYDIQRNDLITALNKKGPGKLVHPYLGVLKLQVASYTWRETNREMNMVRFVINVIEAGDTKFPIRVQDTVQEAAEAKSSALDAVKAAFAKAYNLNKYPATVSTATLAMAQKASAAISSAKSTVSTVASYQRSMENFENQLDILYLKGSDLINDVSDLIGFGTNQDDEFEATNENALSSFNDMDNMKDVTADEVVTSDPEDPTRLLEEAFQTLTIINQVGLLTIIDFESAQEAEILETQVFERIDEVLESTTDDDTYNALYDLRTVVAENLDNRAKSLPLLVEYIPRVTTPALVIAHELYGNVDREQELIDRNRIQHPGFTPGQVPIEVLIDV